MTHNRKFISGGMLALSLFALLAALLLSSGTSAAQTGGSSPTKGAPYNRPYDSNSAAAALHTAQISLQHAQTMVSAAQGKGTDVTTLSGLLSNATDLYNQANGFNASGDYYKAGSYASATSVACNAINLWLNSINPTAAPGMPTASRVNSNSAKQASTQLTSSYNQIVVTGKEISAYGESSYSYYITTAQGFYQQAYSAYQAGNYNQSIYLAISASQTARIADVLVRSKNAPPAGAGTSSAVPPPGKP